MSVRLGLLGLIRDQPGHGYDLKVRYDEVLDPARLVQPAQLYSTLKRLERDGLITLSHVDREGGPERRTFEVTAQGERELDRWLSEAVEPEPRLHTVLYTKVVLALLSGHSVDDMLDVQREAHLVRMRELTGLRQSSSPAMALLAEYTLFHLNADLQWLEFTASRVGDLREQLADAFDIPRRDA